MSFDLFLPKILTKIAYLPERNKFCGSVVLKKMHEKFVSRWKSLNKLVPEFEEEIF